jgi:hypothetical protein
MRFLFVLLASLACVTASAQTTVVVRTPRVFVTAQDHAVVIARRGTLVHSSCSQTEGIGMGSTPEAARRNCCFFGRRQIVEEGVAFSPVRRMWFAVIRYR